MKICKHPLSAHHYSEFNDTTYCDACDEYVRLTDAVQPFFMVVGNKQYTTWQCPKCGTRGRKAHEYQGGCRGQLLLFPLDT